MADELQFIGDSGDTITASVYTVSGTSLQTGTSCPEQASTGVYSGDISGSAVSDTTYNVVFNDGTNNVGAFQAKWDGTQFVEIVGTVDANVTSVTIPAASLQTALSGTNIYITEAVTFTATFSGTIPGTYTDVIFTIKHAGHLSDADTSAILKADDTTGLIVLNGSASGDATGVVVTVDEPNDQVTITIKDHVTEALNTFTSAVWDLKYIDSASSSGLISTGKAYISATPTRQV